MITEYGNPYMGTFQSIYQKKRVKEEVCKNLMKNHNYVSRIRGNTAAQPELKYILDFDASLQRK